MSFCKVKDNSYKSDIIFIHQNVHYTALFIKIKRLFKYYANNSAV